MAICDVECDIKVDESYGSFLYKNFVKFKDKSLLRMRECGQDLTFVDIKGRKEKEYSIRSNTKFIVTENYLI